MRKIFTLLSIMAVAFGVKAEMVTEQVVAYNVTGVDNVGTAADGTTTNTDEKTFKEGKITCYKLANGWKNGANSIRLTATNGFKKGDVVTWNNFVWGASSGKYGKAVLSSLKEGTKTDLFTPTDNAPDWKTDANNISHSSVVNTFTLTEDVPELILIRSGNTGTFVSYISVTRTYDNGDGDSAPISWNTKTYDFNIGDEVTAPIFSNEENLAVTFASTNTELATVSETGVITLNNTIEGTATVSATYTAPDENAPYKTTVASVVITSTYKTRDEKVQLEYEMGSFESDVFYITADKQSVDTGFDYYTDENISVKGVFKSSLKSTTANAFDKKFTHYVDVRVSTTPNADNLTGDGNKDSNGNYNATPLVVTPQKDMTVYFIVRLQAKETKTTYIDENNYKVTKNEMSYDASYKPLHVRDQAAIDTDLPYEGQFGCWLGDGVAYLLAASAFELEAGKTYTVYAQGGTIGMFGVAYKLPAVAAPEAPVMKDENGNELSEINLDDTEGVTVKFEATEGHNVYYLFTANAPAVTPEAAPAKEAAATLEHEGETYTLAPAEGVKITEAGTLKYFAHNPATDARSEVKSATATGTTTGIADINADVNAPVEYFNLQGIRVANPENGMFIRRQGTQVTKVIK